jgi:hypothetical protein
MNPFAYKSQSYDLKSLEQMQVSLTEICLVWTMTLFVIIVSFRNIFSEMRSQKSITFSQKPITFSKKFIAFSQQSITFSQKSIA